MLLVAILTGFADRAHGRARRADRRTRSTPWRKIFFGIIGIIVRVAPIGAFGAMAFTVGAYGVGSLWNLVELIADLLCDQRCCSC